jgi:hypothetical protein
VTGKVLFDKESRRVNIVAEAACGSRVAQN